MIPIRESSRKFFSTIFVTTGHTFTTQNNGNYYEASSSDVSIHWLSLFASRNEYHCVLLSREIHSASNFATKFDRIMEGILIIHIALHRVTPFRRSVWMSVSASPLVDLYLPVLSSLFRFVYGSSGRLMYEALLACFSFSERVLISTIFLKPDDYDVWYMGWYDFVMNHLYHFVNLFYRCLLLTISY